MPYDSVFVPNEEFLTHKGVTIYSTKEDNDAQSTTNEFLYAQADDADEGQWFDVRDLPGWHQMNVMFETHKHTKKHRRDTVIVETIKANIDSGVLTQDGVNLPTK